MSDWISVEDRTPDVDAHVIAHSRRLGVIPCKFYCKKQSKWLSLSAGYFSDVTHWQPLPGPPAPESAPLGLLTSIPVDQTTNHPTQD